MKAGSRGNPAPRSSFVEPVAVAVTEPEDDRDRDHDHAPPTLAASLRDAELGAYDRDLAWDDRRVYASVDTRFRAMADTQISAFISAATKELVERYAEAHGVKKGYLVEEALLHHLQALRELPADIVVPPRLILTATSFEAAAKLVKKPRKATKALRDLMAGKAVDGEP